VRLFLVRHGETEFNRQGLALGRSDVPLTEHGRWQAERLGTALAGELIAAVYSSPLQRALDTARPIAERHGLSVQVDEGLLEMDIGETEGLAFAEVRARYPDLLRVWTSADGPTYAMPGGERLVDVEARGWGFVDALTARHPQESVVAVSHNFVILCILSRVMGLALSDFRRLRHAVAAVSVVDFRPDRMRAVRLNDLCHLESEG